MSVVDLHPETLLSKEIRGELDAAERERLDAHLSGCPTCRLERKMRADYSRLFERDALSPQIAGVVESLARTKAPAVPAPPRAPALPRSASSPRGRRRVSVLLAAATLTMVAGAFAATEPGRRMLAPLFEAPRFASTGLPSVIPATPPRMQAGSLRVAAPASAESPAPALEPAPTPALEPTPTPALTLTPAPTPASARPSPSTLFAEESEARRKGDDARLLDLHAQLVARYPQSPEAQVSHMIVARSLLERGDSSGALDGFDAYLRTGTSTLREDALGGRASALDRLGRSDEARQAWTALLDQYPNTAYAAHARARIEASSGN